MHRLLERQLHKYLGGSPLPPEFQPFLDAVDAAYEAGDQDRIMTERAMDLASDELIGRNQQLEMAIAKLQEADDMRRHFINTAAHELGTPLTPLKLQVSTLRRRYSGDGDGRSIDILERNVDRIILLVNDLMDSAKIQSQRLKVDSVTVDLAQAVEGAISSNAAYAEAAGISLKMPEAKLSPVFMEPGRLAQLLDNVLGNAIKYSPNGGTITTTIEKEADWVTVAVSDMGVGVAPQDIDRLFKPFSQLEDNMGRTNAGTGLGLFICKGLVEAVGGSMWMTSEGLGKGATVGFRLPAAE